MLDKIRAAWAVLQTGKKVANPTAWKLGQVAASDLAVLFGAVVALAAAFGYSLPVTDEQMAAIAGGVIAVYGVANRVLTVATTDKIGSRYDVNTVDKPAEPAPPAADPEPVREPDSVPAFLRREPSIPAELQPDAIRHNRAAANTSPALPDEPKRDAKPDEFIDYFRDAG